MNTEILGKKISLGFSIIFDPILNYIKLPNIRRNTRYARYYKHLPIKKNTILYESFYGRGLLCGPYALFQELIQNPKYSKYHHVWVLDDLDNHTKLIRKYKDRYSNVSFVAYDSKKYLRYLASAGYLINNVTFPGYFVKKTGQIYVNTWHGIPLKHIGYDVPSGALNASNMGRNFLHADYLISANPFLTDIYKQGFRQEGISKTRIIEEGYPRLDLLANTEQAEVFAELEEAGVSVDRNKKVILYAPTWREYNYNNPRYCIAEFVQLKETLDNMIDTDKYQILVKVHQFVYNILKEELNDFPYVIPATVDANLVLGVTDILISDFSSIYFDYLATGKPVLFYITDLERYSSERGLYFTVDDLPGPVTESLDTVGNWINNIEQVFEKNRERYKKVRDWCCGYDIGNISKKIVSAIFDGETDGVRIISCTNRKKKILISRGPVHINGVSSALINLLKQFDYEKYDVTVFASQPRNANERGQIMRIADIAGVRVIVRPFAMPSTIVESIWNSFHTLCNPIKGLSNIAFKNKLYSREFRRLYGETEFDYIIDYEGYNTFFATVCLTQKNATTCIWLHSDMYSEFNTRFYWLKRLFALYPKFDFTVSCSKEIMEVNRKNFANYLPAEKFKYAKNCVDFERVKDGSRMGKLLFNGKYYYTLPEITSLISMKLLPLQPEVFEDLVEGTVEICPNDVKVDNGVVKFVTLGRLSVEKNQAALIQAFARLTAEFPDTMLYIIGDGPERNRLMNQIKNLNLQEKIILTGNLPNPFGLLAQCDCFILPSLHEGQPITVFEARALHMPIIVSNFESVGGLLLENGQCLVEMDADSIYEGLHKYMEGGVPSDYAFDDVEYNRQAYGEFKTALGIED